MFVEIESSNSIRTFNWFEEKGHVEQKYNNFKLIDLTREELHTKRVPDILDDNDEL